MLPIVKCQTTSWSWVYSYLVVIPRNTPIAIGLETAYPRYLINLSTAHDCKSDTTNHDWITSSEGIIANNYIDKL